MMTLKAILRVEVLTRGVRAWRFGQWKTTSFGMGLKDRLNDRMKREDNTMETFLGKEKSPSECS